MTRAKMVYISGEAHQRLKLLAARRNRPMGQVVQDLVEVDCQTLATLPRDEIVRPLGRFPPELMRQIDDALQDALGLAASSG